MNTHTPPASTPGKLTAAEPNSSAPVASPQRASLSGLLIPLITPFLDGDLDEQSLQRLVAHYNTQPVKGLFLAATTGEGLTLDDAETQRLVMTVAQANKSLPLHLGVCGSDTRKLAKTLERTRDWPIDGYLVTCPYYSRPSQEGIYQHFSTLAGATEGPLVLYNIPYRTGVNMTNDTVLRLAELDNVIGLKDCCANPAQSFDLLQQRPPNFAVLTGEDAMFHAALCQGADGGILASAHVETQAFAMVGDALRDNDLALAGQIWSSLGALPRLLFSEPSPAAIKYWLWRQGLISSAQVRLPMTNVTPALAASLDAMIAARQ